MPELARACGEFSGKGAKLLMSKLLMKMARETGLEPAASAVTGRRSNQLSYSRGCRNQVDPRRREGIKASPPLVKVTCKPLRRNAFDAVLVTKKPPGGGRFRSRWREASLLDLRGVRARDNHRLAGFDDVSGLIIGVGAGGDTEPRNQDTGHERNNHNLQVGRLVS
jgi:hypothetical protein